VMRGRFLFSPDTTITLRDVENHPDFAYIPLNNALPFATAEEYLLLENRETDPDSTLGELRLQTDSLSGVVLGTARVRHNSATDSPVTQTGEYDVLEPASGILCLHVDNSAVFFAEVNSDVVYGGVNTNPDRLGIGIIQGDGSRSIGDPASPYFFGGPYDTFF